MSYDYQLQYYNTNTERLSERPLPFDFHTKITIKDIMKSTKILTKSSDKFNSYLNNFYSSKAKNTFFNTNAQENFHEMKNRNLMLLKSKDSNENFKIAKNQTERNPRIANRFLMSIDSDKTKSDVIDHSITNNFYYEKNFNKIHTNLLTNMELKNSKIINSTPARMNYYESTNNKFQFNKIMKRNELINSLKNINLSQSIFYNIFDLFYSKEYKNENMIMELDEFEEKQLAEKLISKIEYFKNGGEFSKTCNPMIKTYTYKQINHENDQELQTISEILLKLKPMTIEFIDPKESILNERIILNIPFEFLPIFCFCSFKDIIFIFSQILEFNETFTNISINPEKFKLILNKYNLFDPVENDLKTKINENLFKNTFKFNWITPLNKFEVIVTSPMLEIIFPSKNLVIQKYPERDFLFMIYFHDFKNWDFYSLNYLNHIKHFRVTINKILTKTHKDDDIGLMKKTVYIDQKSKINNKTYSLNDNGYAFGYTNKENQTHFIKIYGFGVNIEETITKKFSIEQSRLLMKLSSNWNVEYSIRKAVIYNHKTGSVDLNMNYLQNIDENFINFSQKCNSNKFNDSFNMINKLKLELM